VRYYAWTSRGSDLVLDLERADPCHFVDNEYHTVICIEVLEHLDTAIIACSRVGRAVALAQVIVSHAQLWPRRARPSAKATGNSPTTGCGGSAKDATNGSSATGGTRLHASIGR